MMGINFASILTLCIVFLSMNVVVMGKNSTDNERWLARFNAEAAQTFLRTLDACPKDSRLYFQSHGLRKKDEISTAIDDSADIVKTDVRNFPKTEQTTQMMFALFGNDGLFQKDGFQRSGMISADGTAQVTVTKVFPNKTELLGELRESKTATIGSGAFSVLTQMLFLPEDITKLEYWLIANIDQGNEGTDEPCSPKVVINYKCCEPTAEPTLAPQFGSIDFGID